MTSIRAEIRRITQHGGRPFTAEVTVESVEPVSRSFVRVSVRGETLTRYRDVWPADAFKLHLHDRGEDLVRAYTVRSFDPGAYRLTFDVALHGEAPAMRWLERVTPGDTVELTGMRHEFAAPEGIDQHLLIGDATALPGIGAILDALPADVPRTVFVAGHEESDRALLPRTANAHWVIGGPQRGAGSPLAELVRAKAEPRGRTQAWLAAEAGVVRELRRFVLGECGLDRADMRAAAYWKAGLDSTAVDAVNIERYQRAAADGADITDPDVVDRLEFERA